VQGGGGAGEKADVGCVGVRGWVSGWRGQWGCVKRRCEWVRDRREGEDSPQGPWVHIAQAPALDAEEGTRVRAATRTPTGSSTAPRHRAATPPPSPLPPWPPAEAPGAGAPPAGALKMSCERPSQTYMTPLSPATATRIVGLGASGVGAAVG
jgi:hypothetical protein